MGHKISKEQIDPGVKDHIMSFVGDVADLETEVNTDIISAVNSLIVNRVDNAENMGKLANAIGEPVTANHSVDEVVEGLGEMLSTFKTNMMNSGVMVESSDKFKQLIDKIKGLTEGEGNKGVQFAEGTCNLVSPSDVIVSNLTFKPVIILLHSEINTSLGIVMYNSFIDSTLTYQYYNDEYRPYTLDNYNYYVNDTGFKIRANVFSSSYEIKYYAIGVGEEDTTLRDSLASILTEEGVSVTEEDDMASLITKVDEEFTKDNNTISSMKQELADALVEKGVDVNTENTFDELVDSLINMNVGEVFPGISCRSSLPAEVEDGHIIIITENYNKIYVDNKKIDKMNLSEGDVYIKYGLESPYTENLNNLDSPISIHLEVVYQMINNEIVFVDEIYKGVDGEWVKILDSRVYYFNEGVFKVSSSAISVNNMSQYNMGLITSGDFNNYFKLDVQYSNGNSNGILAYGSDYKIDLTQFSKIKMTYTQKCTDTSNYGYTLLNDYTPGYFGLFTASEREVFYVGDSRMTCSKFVGHTRTNYDKEFTIEMDVTNIDGEHYFGVGIATQGTTVIRFSGLYIKSIEFIK